MRDFKAKTVFILYFISGFTALVFEVVWSRQACLIFGNTTLASAAVISAYMTGLALGSYFFGKLADRMPQLSLRFYAILEGAIGVFALCFPFLIKILVPVYRTIYLSFYQDFLGISAIRYLLSFLILMIPTILMGGTFPFLSRFFAKDRTSMNTNITRLYAMNLFGAMAGTFMSGFFMISAFGLNTSSAIAALLNLGIFAFIIRFLTKSTEGWGVGTLHRGEAIIIEQDIPVDESERAPGKNVLYALIALMAIHGFSAFVIQICWLRTMALILGSSTYAFSAVLTTFLAGLGLGTYAVSLLAKKNRKLELYNIGFMELGIGVSILLFIPIFEWLIYFLVLLLPAVSKSMMMVFTIQFIFSAVAMIVPTFLIGLVFPSVIYFIGRPKDIGKWVGTTYAVNTAGGVIGSFSAAFFLISHFGLNGSLHMVSVLSVTTGLLIILIGSLHTPKLKSNLTKAIIISSFSLLLLLYPWDKNMFSSGAFIYAQNLQGEARMGKLMFQKSMQIGNHLLYYKDGISSTVSVLQHRLRSKNKGINAKSLRVNGKTDASTIGDMDTQLCLGYIPMFAHPNPKKVLVIGLGAGITLNTITEFDSVTNIECVEIEPAVVEANRYFSSENNNVLDDPRLKLIIGDGRNHLEFSPEKYDIIISEPSNPWISGVSSLFSSENYEAALSKLEPDGIYCQWFHAYQMSREDFMMIINTFASVFPQASLYKISPGDYMLLGSCDKIVFDYEKMEKLIAGKSGIENHLKYFSRYGNNFILGTFLLSDTDLRQALKTVKSRFNTDDRLYLEYNAPKHLYKATSADTLHWLYSVRRNDIFPEFYNADREKILNLPDTWKIFMEHGLFAMEGKNYDSAIFYFKEALRLHPDDPVVVSAIARSYEKKKDYQEARKHYEMLEQKEDWKTYAKRALLRIRLKNDIERDPILWRNTNLFNLLGGLVFLSGDTEEGEKIMTQAINIDPTYAKNYSDLALYYFLNGYEVKGQKMLQKARALDSREPTMEKAEALWNQILKRRKVASNLKRGIMSMSLKHYGRAKHIFKEILKDDPGNFMAYGLLAETEVALGNKEMAKKYAAKADELYANIKYANKQAVKLGEVNAAEEAAVLGKEGGEAKK